MKRIAILFLFVIIAFNTFSQEENLQFKLDSIVKEADLLYRYEKVAWNSSDLFMLDSKLKKNYGGYLIFQSNDTIFATFNDKSQKEKIAKYYFTNADVNFPFKTEVEVSALTKTEQELLNIKTKIINQLYDKKYEVTIPQGFNPNIELIKEKDGYKLYMIMGTPEPGIISFGNDYLFRADLEGNIIGSKKFHSRMIPAQSKGPNGEVVVSAIHSHLKTTPYITATDICTFRL